jgi:protein-tyrosine-phosphatase
MPDAPRGLLFLCPDGAALGPMAEALARKLAPDRESIAAAPTPGHVRRSVRDLLRARGLETAGLRARAMSEVDAEEIGHVFVLGEGLSLPPLASRLAVHVWPTPDPLSGPPGEHREACEAALDRLEARLSRWLTSARALDDKR